MKSFSKVALVAALFASTAGLVAVAPAIAKKAAADPSKPAPLNLSPEVRTAAVAVQTAMAAKDWATAETQDTAILAAAKNDDDRYIGQAFKLQIEANKLTAAGTAGNEATLAAPLDALLANPRTPPSDLPRFAFLRGNIAFNAKQYPQALALFERARAGGFQDSSLPLQIVRAKVEGGDVKGGMADLEASIQADKAAGRPVTEDLYRYAISRLYKSNDIAGAQRWSALWLHDYGTPKNWRDAIFVFGFQGAAAQRIDNRQRVDLFRLMRATKSLAGQSDYLEYADLASRIGLSSETKSVIDMGKANGAIPATSKNATELLAEATRQIGMEGSVASQQAKAKAAPNGSLAADTGDFCIGNGNYACAVEMYTLALSKGSGAKPLNLDEINTHMGIAKAMTGDKAGAKAAFAEVKTAPRTDIAALWLTYLDSPAYAAS